MIGISGTVAISGNRGRATLRAVESIHRIDSQLGRRLDINSAWRDPFEQEKLYNAYRAYVNGNGPWAPIALRPEDSVHCKGEAIDTDDSAQKALLNRNGWFQTVYRNGVLVEPWHFEYDYNRDQFKNQGNPSGGGATPVTPKKGFLMALTDAQQQEIYNNICGVSQRPLARVFAEELLNFNIPRATDKMGGNTNLRGFLAYADHNNIVTREKVAELAHAIALHVTKTVGEAVAEIEREIAKENEDKK